MRPSSRKRVAAWLLALPAGTGGEECARRGRLEMISFWLLCWKLLRATAGLRRTTAELTEGNHDNSSSDNSHPADSSSTPTQPTDPVTMEISSSPPLTDLQRDNLFNCHSPEVEELHYPEFHGLEEAAERGNGKSDGDECDYLVFEIGKDRGGLSEEGQDTERGAEEEEDGGRGETEGEDEGRGEIEGEEGRGEIEGEVEERREIKVEDDDRGQIEGEDRSEEETENKDWGRREIEGEDEGREKIEGEDGESGETEGGMKEDALSEFLFISGSPLHPLSSEPLTVNLEQPAAMSQEAWGHDLGNRDDLSEGHLSDCLQAELAVVYSDSDTGDDQWAAFTATEVTNQEQTCDGQRKEDEKVEEDEQRQEEEREAEAESGREEQREEGTEGRRGGHNDDEDDEELMRRRDLFLRSPSASSTASSTDPDRRVPADFCVYQKMRSDNVSSEHVDFLLARQQWKKMEEEVKGRPIPKPGLRAQGSFQGTHTSLYPPTRSPRLKHREINPPVPREPPLSSTLSPSSEDSGLDDSSYRSPLEEQESAVEREIRLTLEREERHRRERGMIAQGLIIPRPSTLQTGRSPPRPPACRTPTLSISPSPPCSSSLPRSLYHEMTANNVIILEPDSSSSASRNRLISSTIGGLSDWPTSLDVVPSTNVIVVETSNLIIRSASEFCLSSASPVTMETQESTFSSNPFFKLRSLSSQSLVEQEIKMVRQREEEWRRQREEMWKRRREEEWRRGRERYDTVLVSPGLNDNISFNVPEVPDRCVSSPSSPSRTRKMERASLSCDHKWFS
ncbi:cyclic nucleotide-gated channel beta-1-like isoform X2 [Paralichthys olivaceus]|uniref:cyclic nucleotide-gated channel beta-1-like isoform X2 n=1 Tax=Paralichthys olivaceus TaxID=8255 RepID=UPI00375321A3